MLRYDGIDAFEKWLRQCPLDPRTLTYSTARTGDGMLNVQCVWRMPGNLSAPKESCEHAAGSVAAPGSQQNPRTTAPMVNDVLESLYAAGTLDSKLFTSGALPARIQTTASFCSTLWKKGAHTFSPVSGLVRAWNL